MMLYPAMNKLTQYIPNRYMMVNVVARRARQIAIEAERHGEPLDEKPVTLAINEVAEGRFDAKSIDTAISDEDVTGQKGESPCRRSPRWLWRRQPMPLTSPMTIWSPEGTDIAVGMRVLAPFGRGNRVSEGVVLALGQGVPDKPIKPIRSVVDREPVITDREIRLALWMRERYFCTFYDAIRTILPAGCVVQLSGDVVPDRGAACRRTCRSGRRRPAACWQDGPHGAGRPVRRPGGKPEGGCCRF